MELGKMKKSLVIDFVILVALALLFGKPLLGAIMSATFWMAGIILIGLVGGIALMFLVQWSYRKNSGRENE